MCTDEPGVPGFFITEETTKRLINYLKDEVNDHGGKECKSNALEMLKELTRLGRSKKQRDGHDTSTV